MGQGPFLTLVLGVLLFWGAHTLAAPPLQTGPAWAGAFPLVEAQERPAWSRRLEQALRELDRAHDGELGVYVKDLNSGVEVSLRGDESWYLASGIKVPVAMAVLRNIEAGKYSLDSELYLLEADFVDGAGTTNWQMPGTRLQVSHLIEQMLTVSDNTASDILIRTVGIAEVNALVRELVPEGVGEVTSLADVRRHAYSVFHPDAFNLIGRDFLTLRQERDELLRIRALARILGLDPDEFAVQDLDTAFATYYATDLNAGRLSAFGAILETLVTGEALSPESTAYLLDVLFNVETGKARIKAGLPAAVAFAHKTGTQHRRMCDLGVAMSRTAAEELPKVPRNPQRFTAAGAAPSVMAEVAPGVVIAACSRDFQSLARAEASLRAVGEAVADSGVFDTPATGSANAQVPDPAHTLARSGARPH